MVLTSLRAAASPFTTTMLKPVADKIVNMVFTDEGKAIIEADYEEKGWSAYIMWKQNPSKGWVESSVRRLIRKHEKTGTMGRRPGISSQEEPGTHTDTHEEDLYCPKNDQ